MVLNIRQVQPDVSTGRDAVLLVAALGEALDDVGFAAEQAQEGHDLFAAVADGAEQGARVLGAGGEDFVFDGVGLVLDVADDGAEGVDDVVAGRGGLAFDFCL